MGKEEKQTCDQTLGGNLQWDFELGAGVWEAKLLVQLSSCGQCGDPGVPRRKQRVLLARLQHGGHGQPARLEQGDSSGSFRAGAKPNTHFTLPNIGPRGTRHIQVVTEVTSTVLEGQQSSTALEMTAVDRFEEEGEIAMCSQELSENTT